MAIPLTQTCALIAFAVFAARDSALDRFVPYVVFATVACLVADGFRVAKPFAGRAQGVGPGAGPCGS